MAENVELSLLERLVHREVQAQLRPLHAQLWAHHWVLTELVRQLPRPAVLAAAQRLDQMCQLLPAAQREAMRGAQQSWHLYLSQLGAVVDGETPPEFDPGQPVPARLKPAL